MSSSDSTGIADKIRTSMLACILVGAADVCRNRLSVRKACKCTWWCRRRGRQCSRAGCSRGRRQFCKRPITDEGCDDEVCQRQVDTHPDGEGADVGAIHSRKGPGSKPRTYPHTTTRLPTSFMTIRYFRSCHCSTLTVP